MVLSKILRELQAESERCGSAADRRDRRLILRGLRLAAWAMTTRLTPPEIRQEFHQELFRAIPPTQ
ncbi:hypothetical protein VC34_26235 [Pseudomonas fluorescens]|uniref:Uncharacterized protein n=1 Tax=Pseudomonas fluorescens TaxID=294 RepID=A0A0F4SYH9_PSEFL|nr:hypothetical protein VC34_26235 [Pseudomonas fluorescens]